MRRLPKRVKASFNEARAFCAGNHGFTVRAWHSDSRPFNEARAFCAGNRSGGRIVYGGARYAADAEPSMRPALSAREIGHAGFVNKAGDMVSD